MRIGRCQGVVDRPGGAALAPLADAAGEIALGIEVDEEHSPAGKRQRRWPG